MQTLKFHAQVGEDGVLKIELPQFRGRSYAALLVLVNEDAAPLSRYPEGWFESTSGAWQGEFPEIEDLPLEEREEILS